MSYTLLDSEHRRAAVRYNPPRGWRIVIAEDEALPAELLKRTLIHLGHQVVGSAQNGKEAIALARALAPDAIIMDLRMPVMDGWTATAELTRAQLGPVVVVSALEDHESMTQALDAGASAFLTKPVREEDLRRALELAMARFTDAQEIQSLRAQAEEQLRELERVLQELRETHLQLASAARRAALTSLAHGLAHEINNALTPIIGNAQILALLHDAHPETLERSQIIIDHARRIANWTASFRQLTTGVEQERIEFSFNDLVRQALKLYGERLQRLNIVAHTALDESLPPMAGYPDQIQQMVMMLIQNAVEALHEGGEIDLRSEYATAQAALMVTISDTGSGILPEHLPLIFEPGFTTKSNMGHAQLGWGLYTVKQIVNAHQGRILVISPRENSSAGTIVQVTLPLSSRET